MNLFDMLISSKKMIFDVDFDHTICFSKFPDCGPGDNDIIEDLKFLKSLGHTMILWTCRDVVSESDVLTPALDWCKEQGLIFDYINENDPERIEKHRSDSRKIVADWYVDDKGIHPFDFKNSIREYREFLKERE